MKPSPGRDLAVGVFVLIGLAALGVLSLQVGGIRIGADRTRLVATFDEIGGLKPRAAVVVAGVRVGEVASIHLDEDLRARVTLEVGAEHGLPLDTRAAIRTSGVLGDQYVALEPGGDDALLASGDEIAFTTDALSIERLIGQLVHGGGLDE